MIPIQGELNRMAIDLNADFFGVADLSPAHDAIMAQGGPALAKYARAISIGIALFDPIVDQLPNRAQRAVALTYRHHCYDFINNRLDNIASRLSSKLSAAGYEAFPVPASQTVDDVKLLSIFSNKMAAQLSGLGWIGKSCLLVTPEVGPRVRWASILTNAPLEPTGQPLVDGCGDCTECVDACPVHAFTGRHFKTEEPREARFAAHKCKAYFNQLTDAGGVSVCGMCLYVCPYGHRNALA